MDSVGKSGAKAMMTIAQPEPISITPTAVVFPASGPLIRLRFSVARI